MRKPGYSKAHRMGPPDFHSTAHMERAMKVTASHERRLGPRLIALFIDAGFMRSWPLEWTPAGLKARKDTFRG